MKLQFIIGVNKKLVKKTMEINKSFTISMGVHRNDEKLLKIHHFFPTKKLFKHLIKNE